MARTREPLKSVPRPKRILFARIGWMKYYAGPQAGDEKPRGGGAYTRDNTGHEVFNFAPFGERLYGFVRAKNRRIRLDRIDPSAHDVGSLDDVLVVFVAKQFIVGWYWHAVVHRESVSFSPGVLGELKQQIRKAKTRKFRIEGYRFETRQEDAVLLPTWERTYRIPAHVKGGFGQSNVFYLHENDGQPKIENWVKNALTYVLNYDKDNLLSDPNAENRANEAAAISLERSAGFQSNVAIRTAVEDFAMRRALEVLKARGYSNIRDTSKFKPYDYVCNQNGERFFVEVKGSQTPARSIFLTRGEVEHVRKNRGKCILVIVHSILVGGKRTVNVQGGTVSILNPWLLKRGSVSPLQFVWTVPE